MAYFYNSSNYSEIPVNYQYYYNHDSYNYDPRYVQYYNTEIHENAYQHVSTPPLVGYYYSNYSQPESLTSKNALFHENGDYYDEPVSTEYVVSYNTTAETEANNVVFEEYNPEPFQGGYDINEKYGKPMSPSEKICYPPSKDKIDPNNVPSLNGNSFGSVPNPYVKEDKRVESEAEPKPSNGVTPNKVIQEEHPSDFEDGDEEDDYDDDDYDDEYDDGDDDVGEDDGDENAGEKHDDLGKEPSKTAVIASLGNGGVDKKQDQNLEGVAKPQNEGIVGEMIQEKKASDFEPAKKEEEEEDDDDDDDYDDDEFDDDDDVGEEGKGEEKEGNLGNKEPSKAIIPVTSLDDAIREKEAKNLEDEAKPKNGSIVGEVIQEQKPSNFEKNQEEQQKEANMSDQVSKVEDHRNQIRRQIPPGYGMEALDLCEGLFGGYFPCLWKRKQGNISTNANNQQSGNYCENMSDYDYCCKETVDYFFGNPNPYGGSMLEKGSYGDPVYSYQRYYPQQPLTEQVDCYGANSSWMNGSRYYYGHTGDYQ